MKLHKKILIILPIVFVVFVLIVGIYGYYRYSSIQNQLEKTRKQIGELPELEEDIFAKCIGNGIIDVAKIAKCQESTQEQIHTLSQDLKSIEKELNDKSIWELIIE